TALKKGKEIVSPPPNSPEAKFKVLDQSKANDLKRARPYNSHLALGALFAQAGMLEDAEHEFQLLVKANPDSATAQKLLKSVKRLKSQNSKSRRYKSRRARKTQRFTIKASFKTPLQSSQNRPSRRGAYIVRF